MIDRIIVVLLLIAGLYGISSFVSDALTGFIEIEFGFFGILLSVSFILLIVAVLYVFISGGELR